MSKKTKRHELFEFEGKPERLFVGDLAKLLFLTGRGPQTEGMWVQVTKVTDTDEYEGTLDNDPVILRGSKAGDTVRFTGKNVRDMIPGEFSFEAQRMWRELRPTVLRFQKIVEAIAMGEADRAKEIAIHGGMDVLKMQEELRQGRAIDKRTKDPAAALGR